MYLDGTYEVFGHYVRVPFESFCQSIQDISCTTREQRKECGLEFILVTQILMDEPRQRMAIELSREDRDERTKQAVSGLHATVVRRSVQIKMQGDELVCAEAFATRVQGPKCLHVHQC